MNTQHLRNGWGYFECDICYYESSDADDCIQHEVEEHLFCYPCERFFSNYNAIKQVSKLTL